MLMINKSEIYARIYWIKGSLFRSIAFLTLLSHHKSSIDFLMINNQMLKIWLLFCLNKEYHIVKTLGK